MKVRISLYLMFLMLIYCISAFAGQMNYPHFPIDHSHSSGDGNCKGYAIARAFGKTASSTTCKATDVNLGGFDTNHFETVDTDPIDYDGIKTGDIVYFNENDADHAVYVTSPGSEPADIDCDMIDHDGGEELTGKTLNDVINGLNGCTARGDPTAVYRKIPHWQAELQNKFGNGSNGGQVIFGSDTVNSPYETDEYHWNSVHNIKTLGHNTVVGGYTQIFSEWQKDQSFLYDEIQTEMRFDYNTWSHVVELDAIFDNQYNITFRNEFTGVGGNPGSIKVDGDTEDSPCLKQIKDGTSIQGQAIYQVYDHIQYTFDEWSDEYGSATRNETPDDHEFYTAKYTGKPVPMTYYNLHIEGDPGDYITLAWNTHPNTNVSQYQIWRKVHHNGQTSDPDLIATRNRGTTSYTDYDYKITDGYTDDIVYYDVRAYYSTEGTYANPDWIDEFGEIVEKRTPPESSVDPGRSPVAYDIIAYPNPFNPSTNLHYQLADQAHVILTVHDLLGREIIKLIDSDHPAGYFNIQWNGIDASGNSVSAGMYLYRFVVFQHKGGDAVRKSGKLLLVK